MQSLIRLLPFNWKFPTNKQNWFAAKRLHDIHTGVDIFADVGTTIHSLYNGVVVAIGNFTGEYAIPPSIWWNNTSYVIVMTKGMGSPMYTLYGEIEPLVSIGDTVSIGSVLGKVHRTWR